MHDYRFNPFVYVGNFIHGMNRQNIDRTNENVVQNNDIYIQNNDTNTNNTGNGLDNNGIVDNNGNAVDNNGNVANNNVVNNNGTQNNIHNINLSIGQHDINNKKNAIIYCRLSKLNKKDNNISTENKNNENKNNEKSLDSQENECINFCRDNNLKVLRVVREVCSAYTNYKKNKQIELERILDNITSNDVLIVWEISRFTRNIIDGTRRINILRSKRSGIYIVNDRCGYPMTCEYSDIIRRIIYAQQESDIISERIRRSIRAKRDTGSYIGSFAPYGKKIIRDNNNISRLDINEAEQSIIKKIIDYYDNGKNYNEIFEILKRNNILKREKQWKINSIKKIIRDNIRKFNMNKITDTLMEIDETNKNKNNKRTKRVNKRKETTDMECDDNSIYKYTKSKRIKIEKMDCDKNKTTQVYISDKTTIVSNRVDSNNEDIKIHCLRNKNKK